jgi:hypothetical protein
MTAVPVTRPRRAKLDIPKIRLLSWLGLESIAWGVVIAHLIKWAVSFGYYAVWQVRYSVGQSASPANFTVWDGKDFWDRLVVHFQNGLPGLVIAGVSLLAAVLAWLLLAGWHPRTAPRRILQVLAVLAVATGAGYLAGRAVTGWHVHWFPSQAAPAWWDTWRHDIRDVGIVVVATIIVQLLFTKPKYPADDNPGVRVYLTSIPLALLAALVPIAAVGVLAWKLPWLMHHGLHVGGGSAYAAEANGWLAAGTWITLVMGIAGGLAAKFFIKRVADDIQWFFGERSAAKARSDQGLNALRGDRVIGTPAHRLRTHWLLDHSLDLPARNPWLVRALLAVGFLTIAAAGAGAWLNLVGPAAPH